MNDEVDLHQRRRQILDRLLTALDEASETPDA
jgi:hypothetical protein